MSGNNPVVIDFSQAKRFKKLPKGRLSKTLPGSKGVIHSCAATVSKNGNSMLDVQWKVESDAQDFNGTVIYDHFMLEGKGTGITGERLVALGFADKIETGELDDAGQPEWEFRMKEFTPDDLIGSEADLRIDYEDGSEYPKVTGVFPLKALNLG